MASAFFSRLTFWGTGKGEAELKNLRKEVRRSIHYNNSGRKAGFFPASEVDRLITLDRISTILARQTSDDLVKFVFHHARKMFLALVCTEDCPVHDLVRIMQAWERTGMSDDQLPVQEPPCIRRGSDGPRCSIRHGSWLDDFHANGWEDILFRFWDDQCMVNPPVFDNRQFRYDLPAESVLPVTSTGKKPRNGTFSVVSQVTIHKDHYVTLLEEGQGETIQLKRVPSREPVHVALKQMKPPDTEPGYNVAKAWEDEVSALEKIRDLRHPHLVRPLAAIKHGQEHYIMFEWADGGSLRDAWNNTGDDIKILTREHVMCVLEQFVGLAGALAALHNTNTKTRTGLAMRAPSLRTAVASIHSIEQPIQSQTLQVPEIYVRDSSDDFDSDIDRSYVSEDNDPDAEVHWRHGDLKPDNILQFIDHTAGRWLGTLKIADLGLAKQHFLQTSRRHEQTGQRYTTSQYEAPEAMVNLDSPRSRRYDIWSMGCIILEFVIILLYGTPGLDAFYSERKPGPHSTETLYFSLHGNETADVSNIVKHWITQILQEPECSRPGGSAIADLVKLVRQRLLVVDLPEEHMGEVEKKKCRADAGEVQQGLERIWRLGLADEKYLLATTSRTRSQLPPLHATGTRREGARYLRAPGVQAPRQELV